MQRKIVVLCFFAVDIIGTFFVFLQYVLHGSGWPRRCWTYLKRYWPQIKSSDRMRFAVSRVSLEFVAAIHSLQPCGGTGSALPRSADPSFLQSRRRYCATPRVRLREYRLSSPYVLLLFAALARLFHKKTPTADPSAFNSRRSCTRFRRVHYVDTFRRIVPSHQRNETNK